jgi:hypothetical protein
MIGFRGPVFAKDGIGAFNAVGGNITFVLETSLGAQIDRGGLRTRIVVLHVPTKLHGFALIRSIRTFDAFQFALVRLHDHGTHGLVNASLAVQRGMGIQKQHSSLI